MGGGIFGFALAFFEEDKLVIDFTSCHKNSQQANQSIFSLQKEEA